MKAKLIMILACGLKGEIGRNNDLLWKKQRADMARFKTLTSGAAVIMGRKTWESIPEKFRPLPNRINVVISRTMPEQDGIIVSQSIDEAVKKAKVVSDRIFIIGGASIYSEMFDQVDEIELTRIDAEFPDADAFVKEVLEIDNNYVLKESESFDADDSNDNAYTFQTYHKK